jgi:hypothetical protein
MSSLAGLNISKSKEYISESEDEDAPPKATDTAGTSALSDAGEGSGVVSETGNGTGNDSGMEVDA